MNARLCILLTVACLAGCHADTPAPVAGSAKPEFGTFGIDTAQMDTSVKPGDDFYKYVNGTWIATATLPADKARFGVFDALADRAESDVHALVEGLAQSSPPPVAGSNAQKIVDLYQSWMDEQAIESRGIAPLKTDLDDIRAARTKTDILTLMGRLDYAGPADLSIRPDPDDATRYVVNVRQSGLGMPNRDYYLNKGDRYDAYRVAYTSYLATLLELIGDATPAASANAVVALETKLAAVQWPPERQRDVKATTNPVDRAGLDTMIPAIDWDIVLAARGLRDVRHFVVRETTALRDGARLLDTEPVAVWKTYLAVRLASTYAAYLPKAFDDASFAFGSKTLRGIEAQRERWKRGVALVNNLVGEAVGELYVARHFPPQQKATMDALVANLRTAMAERLKTLAWMDEATRAEAERKLATFEPRIGYPSKWRDYSALTIEPGKIFENVRNARRFEWNRQVARLDEPVDRTEWTMTPQTVNAYYSPPMNQITFPAAILQPPFFDPNADLAVNYGAIGAVIGHEMGHGYDDQGRQYDEAGRVRNWWSESTNTKFVEQTRKLAAQYNAFCPLEGLCANGQRTMGENIGDLGGLEMAHTAYLLAMRGQTPPVIDGFTADQRFFLAHSQLWRAIQRDDALRNQILTDPHAPAAARGSIPERNMEAWYTAFDVKEGDRLYIKPEERVRIW